MEPQLSTLPIHLFEALTGRVVVIAALWLVFAFLNRTASNDAILNTQGAIDMTGLIGLMINDSGGNGDGMGDTMDDGDMLS